MKVEQTSELIKVSNNTIQRFVNAIVVRLKSTRNKSLVRVRYQGAFMLIRDEKFDEFTLPDKISKMNKTNALARLWASVLSRINAYLSKYGGRSNMSIHPKPRNLHSKKSRVDSTRSVVGFVCRRCVSIRSLAC
jgi:hypothetical protein